MRKVLGIVTYILILWGLSACSSVRSPFEELVCSPPCWESIKPGETNKIELLDILMESAVVDSSSIEEVGAQDIFDDSLVLALYSDSTARIYLLEDTVMLMSFSRNLDITFGEALQKFGTPDSVLYDWGVMCKHPVFAYGDYMCVAVQAINRKAGVYFGSLIPLSDHVELTADAQVNYVGFFDPDAFDELLEASEFLFGMDQQEFLDALVPWTGYGVLKNK